MDPDVIAVGLLVALLVFTRRVKRAAFTRYEGQAGSAELALNMLGKGDGVAFQAALGGSQPT